MPNVRLRHAHLVISKLNLCLKDFHANEPAAHSFGFRIMLEWKNEELDKGLAGAVCLLYLSEYFTWIARAATAPGYGPYIIYDVPRTLVIIQLCVDVAIILFLVYYQGFFSRGQNARNFPNSRNRSLGFDELSWEHTMPIVLLACLAATDLINVVNEKNFAWLELALKVAYYGLLLLLSCIRSTPTFKTLTLLPTTVFAVMIVASNVAAETESGNSSLYLATVFENMLVVECAHMFYHLKPMQREQEGLGLGQALMPVNAVQEAPQIPQNVHAAARDIDEKYDIFCWLLFFLYFGSEIITFIWRSQHGTTDFTYFVLMITQAAINFVVCAAFIGLSYCHKGPIFEVTSHHVFTFFPFLALMAVNTVVVRTVQGWSWLQLVIDLFGYSVLQIIAGLKIHSSIRNAHFSTMVSIFTAVFVMMIVVILAKHESETGPSLEFIKGVIEQILVLELLHLAFQKLIMNKDEIKRAPRQ